MLNGWIQLNLGRLLKTVLKFDVCVMQRTQSYLHCLSNTQSVLVLLKAHYFSMVRKLVVVLFQIEKMQTKMSRKKIQKKQANFTLWMFLMHASSGTDMIIFTFTCVNKWYFGAESMMVVIWFSADWLNFAWKCKKYCVGMLSAATPRPWDVKVVYTTECSNYRNTALPYVSIWVSCGRFEAGWQIWLHFSLALLTHWLVFSETWLESWLELWLWQFWLHLLLALSVAVQEFHVVSDRHHAPAVQLTVFVDLHHFLESEQVVTWQRQQTWC